MKILSALFLTTLLFHLPSQGAEEDPAAGPPDVDALLKQLKDPDMDERIAALRELMTSVDPRLPEALFPLLSDEGNSTRRLAARAVGSRYWQIPEERVPAFVAALEKNAGSEFEDEKNMVARALGLLKHDYTSNMFSRSADGRWVIYERLGLPCLIDTTTGTEELIGWSPDDTAWVASSWGNSPLQDSVVWHEKEPTAVLTMQLDRRSSTLWAWRHKVGMIALSVEKAAAALGIKEDEFYSPGGFYAEPQDWKGDEITISLYCTSQKGDAIIDHEAILSWDIAKNSVSVISHKVGEQ